MDGNQKEKIGLRIRDRLNKSIKRQQKRQLIRRFTVVAVLLCFFPAIHYYRHLSDISNEVNIHKGDHLTADFRAGYLSLNGNDTIRLAEIESSSSGFPIQVFQEEGMMVVRTASNQFTRKDSIRINVQKGGFYKVILDDGSSVYLNADSKIVYTGNFSDNREVYVDGEAYFEVAKFEKNGVLQPFIVHTHNQKIEVLGTAFNVRTYKDLEEETVLMEGKVKLQAKGAAKAVYLLPNMKATVKWDGETEVKKVDTELYSAWKEGFFYYDDTTLKEILEDLCRYYDIDFVGREVPDLRYTLYLERRLPFSEIIALLEESSDVIINLENKRLKFSTNDK